MAGDEIGVAADVTGVGPDGRTYVADTWNNRIEQFTATGEYVTQWGSAGTGDGQFETPYGVAVAPNGTIYVSDRGNHRESAAVTVRRPESDAVGLRDHQADGYPRGYEL